MSRKSRIEPVRQFLKEARKDSERLELKAASEQLYERAEMLKSFKDVLVRALELCGEEKPKEDKIE